MDFLKTHVFTAFFISISFFIFKSLIKRIYKDDEIQNKKTFKDSILIFVLSYLIFIFKDNLFLLDDQKTNVFTSEPPF